MTTVHEIEANPVSPMLDASINAFSSDGTVETIPRQVIIYEINPSINVLNAIGSSERTMFLRSERNVYALTSDGTVETIPKRVIIDEMESSINALNTIGSAERTQFLRPERNIYALTSDGTAETTTRRTWFLRPERSVYALTSGGESNMVVIRYPTLVRPTHAVAYYNRETFTMKQGDTLPWLDVQLLNVDRTPIDLSDADRVVMRMEHEELEINIVDAPVQIVDPKQGRVRYRWRPGDTDLIGKHNIEFELYYNGGADTVTVPSNRYLELYISREVIPSTKQ